MKKTKASSIAKGGILVALTILILYMGNILKFISMFLLCVASALITLSILKIDIKTTILVYLASTVLSFFIIPDKTICVYYALLFGPYGLIKLYIEKKNNASIEIVFKLLYFNIVGFMIFFIFKTLFITNMEIKSSLLILLLMYNISCFIFDYVLTVFVNFSSKIKL